MNLHQRALECVGILGTPFRYFLSSIAIRWKIWQIQYYIDRSIKDHDIKLAQLEAKNASNDKICNLDIELRTDLLELGEDLQKLRTEKLLKLARRLLVPIPDCRDKTLWESARVSAGNYLTEKGERELRAAVRAERRERSENSRLWIAGVAGLVGAMAALIAVLLRKK